MDGLKIKKIFFIWLIYVQVQTVGFREAITKLFANESLGVKVTTQLASYWDLSKNSWYKQDVSNTTYTRILAHFLATEAYGFQMRLDA